MHGPIAQFNIVAFHPCKRVLAPVGIIPLGNEAEVRLRDLEEVAEDALVAHRQAQRLGEGRMLLDEGHGLFLRDKLHTIVWPYFLWSTAQGLVLVRLSGAVNIPLTYGDLARILWAPISQFWFLYALMVCHLAYLAFAGRKSALLPLAAIGFAASAFMPFLPVNCIVCGART